MLKLLGRIQGEGSLGAEVLSYLDFTWHYAEDCNELWS